MNPKKFEVTKSKVKVTEAFNAKTMSAQYLEKFMSDSHSTWKEDWSWSVGQMSKSQLHFMPKPCPLKVSE